MLSCTISNTTQTVHAWGFEMNDFTVMTSIMVENDVIITIIGVIYKQRQHAFPYRTSTSLRWRHSKFNFFWQFWLCRFVRLRNFCRTLYKQTAGRRPQRDHPCVWSTHAEKHDRSSLRGFESRWQPFLIWAFDCCLSTNLFSSGHFSCAITFRRSVVKILLWSGRNLFTQQLCVHYCTYHVLSSQNCFQTVWFLCVFSQFSHFFEEE